MQQHCFASSVKLNFMLTSFEIFLIVAAIILLVVLLIYILSKCPSIGNDLDLDWDIGSDSSDSSDSGSDSSD